MPINNQSLNKELHKMLKVRGFEPVPKDSTGETSPVPDEADVFKFTFKSGEESKGTAYATIDGDNTLTLYYGDDVTKKINEEDGTESFDLSWTGFLKNMKMWAQRHQMGFELQNKDHLHSDMAQRNYTKKQENMSESAYQQPLQGQDMDKLNEGYFPNGKLSSYNDNIPTVKIVLQHTRQIQEGEQRYRNVARIYLENLQGERILAPTIKPGIAQIYARHLAEGGVPNDERWNHIKSLCEEYSKMAGFVRAVRGNQFNESAQRLVEAGLNHYTNLRETLGKMRGQRGYNAYFESWTPTLMENESDTNTLNELFVQETLDPRIESVMPILQKLSKSISEVKEIKELEEWADKLTEAPGAETLAHNQSTAKSNLKAFDLEEDSVNEGWFADTLRNVGQSVLNRLAPNDKQLLLKLQRDMGVPTTAQHGKPSMARTMSDEEVQKLIAAARKVNAGRNSSLSEEEVEESGLQAYLGNKKYGKKGMDALRKAGREGASKEKMAKIRAKYDKLDEEGVAEGYILKKTKVEKTFTPGDPDEYYTSGGADVTTKDTDYEIINNKTGQVVGTASWTTNDYFGPGALKITMKNGATRWLDIYPSEKGNPQTAFNRFVKDSKTAKKYKEEGVAEGLNEMDKTQTSPGRDGDIDWTKKQIHLGPEHVIKAKDVAKHALKALDKSMKKSHADTPKKKGVAEGIRDDAMAGLQRTIDFAKQHGYKIYRSPTGRKMRFVNKELEHEIRAQVDNYDDSINVNFMDYYTGTSGNDDASYFDQVFKDAYEQALWDYQNRKSDDENDDGPYTLSQLKMLQKQGVAEGWKEKVAGAAIAGAMATGAHGVVLNPARIIGPQGQTVADPYKKQTKPKSKPEDDSWTKIEKRKASEKKGVVETKVDNYKNMGATKDTTHFVKNITTGKIVSPHRSKQDAEDALIANMRDSKDEFKIVRAKKESVEEDLDANQKRVGQLGPTEKVGPTGAVGKLVGANESVEHDPLQDIKRLLGK